MKHIKNFFAISLAICMLLLSGCGDAVPQNDKSGPQPAPAGQETGTDNPADMGMAMGNPDKKLRSLSWDGVISLPDNGFYSLGQDVLPDKSVDGNFYNGVRLYYSDCTTRQSKPLSIPNTPHGYLLEGDFVSLTPLIFTTENKLMVLNGKNLESYNLDLSGHKSLATLENFGLVYFTDGTFLYYSALEESDNLNSAVYKIDLESGEKIKVCTLNENQELYGGSNTSQETLLQNQLLVVEYIYPKNEQTFLFHSVQLMGLDPVSGELQTVYTIDPKGKGLTDFCVTNKQVFWQVEGEYTLHQYNPETKKERTLSISDKAYYHHPLEVWDGKLILSSRREDLNGYDYFTVDMESGTAQPLDIKLQFPGSDYEDLPAIIGSYENYYIISMGIHVGDMWQWDAGQKNLAQVDKPPTGASSQTTAMFGDISYACSYSSDFALVKKDDYWSGKTEYLPFTIVP